MFAERTPTDGSSTVIATTLAGPFNENVPGTSTNTFVGSRVDYLLNQKNTFNVNYNYHRTESDNSEFVPRVGGGFSLIGGGGGGTINYLLPERGSNRENSNHSLRMSETFIASARLIHEARLQIEFDQNRQEARTPGTAVNVLDAFNGGGSPCCPSNTKDFGVEYQDYLTYTYKKHTIKAGMQFWYDKITISGKLCRTYTSPVLTSTTGR